MLLLLQAPTAAVWCDIFKFVNASLEKDFCVSRHVDIPSYWGHWEMAWSAVTVPCRTGLTGVSLLLLYSQLHFCSILSVWKAESGFYTLSNWKASGIHSSSCWGRLQEDGDPSCKGYSYRKSSASWLGKPTWLMCCGLLVVPWSPGHRKGLCKEKGSSPASPPTHSCVNG